jgi:adenylyltransferase/sulfurtransferase
LAPLAAPSSAGQDRTVSGVAQITVQALKARLDRGDAVYLVDVRQPWESHLASLPESILIPLPDLEERIDEVQPPIGALVVTYCHHGIRSLNAAAILSRLGLKDVVSLAGGIDRWSTEIDPAVPRY